MSSGPQTPDAPRTVLHLTVVNQLTAGQLKQLCFEAQGAHQLADASWTTRCWHCGPLQAPFVRQIPAPFRGLWGRKLFAWLLCLSASRRFDIVLLRHTTFDPFAFLFAPWVGCRVSVHHAMEIEELRLVRPGLSGRLASWLERFSGRFSLRFAKAVLGVTQEIADYECRVHRVRKPASVYPNGIDPRDLPVLGDGRDPAAVQAAFICGEFSPWHGLDKLLDAAAQCADRRLDGSLTIHLIGRLHHDQQKAVAACRHPDIRFIVHGHLPDAQYRTILEACDFGIASLAMERQGLTQASTLKVREMLALGLPVYSGHRDLALPSEQPFVLVAEAVDLPTMMAFGRRTKTISRQAVRSQSLPLIDKRAAMAQVVAFLRALP